MAPSERAAGKRRLTPHLSSSLKCGEAAVEVHIRRPMSPRTRGTNGHDEHRLLGHINGVVADALKRAGYQNHEQRPLTRVDVDTNLDGAIEERAVQPADPSILDDEVPRPLHVARRERVLRLDQLLAR